MTMAQPPRQSTKAMQTACDRFNASHPIGSKISVAPGAKDGRWVTVEVARPGAYIMGGHTAVVQVTGGHGCIALGHVRDASPPVLASRPGLHGLPT